jgi:urease accessory protein
MCPSAWHHGYLALDLVCHDGRTAVARQRSRPPLQIFGLQDADGHGGAYLQIVNPCGGLFEGDSAAVEVSLQRGAHLYLTTQAATKVYPSEHGGVTRQRVRLRIASGAILEFFPLPLIPFAGARYSQEIEIRVETGGICLVAEVLAPGRIARGERFAYQMVRSRVQGWVDDRLVLFEQLWLPPEPEMLAGAQLWLPPEPEMLAGAGMLDGQSYVATLYVLTSLDLSPWIRGWNRQLSEQHGACVGITAIAYGGLVVRLLGQTGQEILRRLHAAHCLIRQEGLGLPTLQVYLPFE